MKLIELEEPLFYLCSDFIYLFLSNKTKMEMKNKKIIIFWRITKDLNEWDKIINNLKLLSHMKSKFIKTFIYKTYLTKIVHHT